MNLTLHGGGRGFESPRLHLRRCGSRVKHEGKVEATELNWGFVLQPIGQRVLQDASRAVMWGRVLDFRVTFYDVILTLTAVLARSTVSDLGK
jgi:hypothetical protein